MRVPFVPCVVHGSNSADCELSDRIWQGGSCSDGLEKCVPAIGYWWCMEECFVESYELSTSSLLDPIDDGLVLWVGHLGVIVDVWKTHGCLCACGEGLSL